jgi:hypothetical protein
MSMLQLFGIASDYGRNNSNKQNKKNNMSAANPQPAPDGSTRTTTTTKHHSQQTQQPCSPQLYFPTQDSLQEIPTILDPSTWSALMELISARKLPHSAIDQKPQSVDVRSFWSVPIQPGTTFSPETRHLIG